MENEFLIGSIAYHKLTNEPVIILSRFYQTQYLVRLPNYAEISVQGFELQEKPIKE